MDSAKYSVEEHLLTQIFAKDDLAHRFYCVGLYFWSAASSVAAAVGEAD